MPQPLPPNKMGVTYSRSLTGTRMPSKERFQTRPMGRAFKRCLLSRNFSFRE
jgi:ribosomal protein S10